MPTRRWPGPLVIALCLAQPLLSAACSSDTAVPDAGGADIALSADAGSEDTSGPPYSPPGGALADLCAIVPYDLGAGPPTATSCPGNPPEPGTACQPGTTCQYVQDYGQQVNQRISFCGPVGTYVSRGSVCRASCSPPDPATTDLAGGAAACAQRPIHDCPPAMPGMTRYDRLAAALDVLAVECGLPGHGTGASVNFWFEGECASRLLVRHREPLAAVDDCLAQKLRSVRLSCVERFTCASVGRQLD